MTVDTAERVRLLERRNAALKGAGEWLFEAAAFPRCGHNDPRHPRNEGCEHCKRRANALDAWDEAITPLSFEVPERARTELEDGMTTEARMSDPTPIRGRLLADDVIEALTSHLQSEWAGPYMARVDDFTDEEIEAGELRKADAEAHEMAKAEARRGVETMLAALGPDEQAIERAAGWLGGDTEWARAVLAAALEQPE